MNESSETSAVVVDRLTKVYRNGYTANDEISFSVARGEVFGLLGPNGAGKTTLMRQIAGLSAPTSGTVHVLGRPVDRPAQGGTVGYMPQSPFALNSLTVAEALYFSCHLSGISRRDSWRRVDQIVDDLGLSAVRRRHAAQLSGGQRRLLQLATALVASKPVILLDEPTNELDPLMRRRVWDLLRKIAHERGSTMLFVTHNALEAERVVDRVGIMVTSRLVTIGPPADLISAFPAPLRIEIQSEASGGPDGFRPVEGRAGTWERFVQASEVSSVVEPLEAEQRRSMRVLPVSLEDVYVRRVAQVGHSSLDGPR